MADAKAKDQPAAPSFKPTVLKRVTRPVLKMELDTPVFVKAMAAIYDGKEIKGTGENAQMKPAKLLDVTNLTTGEEAQIVCGTVLVSTLEENYKEAGYVGRCFQITKKPTKATKRYHTFEVLEIADPTAQPAAAGGKR